MTTPTAEDRYLEIMRQFAAMRTEIEDVHAEITQIRDGLTIAASQPATRTASEMTKSFVAVAIARGVSEKTGKDTYKMRGGPYSQNGVTIWPEVLPVLGIDIAALPYGLTQLPTPIEVIVEMHDYTDPQTHETRVTPYKVIGRA